MTVTRVGVLDTRTGRLLRAVNGGMNPHDQILVDTRRERVFVPVYSQNGNGHVSVLDARTGRPLYTVAAGKAPVWMAMDARTGRAFGIDGADTGLRGLDARNGHLVRTVLAGLHPRMLTVDEQTGRAFVPTDAGISVLDTRSGIVLRTVALGQGRLAGLPLLDARSGRVFVVALPAMSVARAPRPGSIIVLDARSGAVVRGVSWVKVLDGLSWTNGRGVLSSWPAACPGRSTASAYSTRGLGHSSARCP
jgi:DNA-binding beta-propeller fold protein YncE